MITAPSQNYISPTRSDFTFGQGNPKEWDLTAEVTFGGDVGNVKTADIQSIKWSLGDGLTMTLAMECVVHFMSHQIDSEGALYNEFRELHCPRAEKELADNPEPKEFGFDGDPQWKPAKMI